MSIKAVFSYRNQDSTTDLNNRFSILFNKGFFDGGVISPIASQLKILITAFKAMSFDGMLVSDTVDTQLTVIAGQTNYICLRAKHNSLTDPTLDWLVLDYSSYVAHTDYDYLILRSVITIPTGATEVLSSIISTVQANEIDTLGRNTIRGVIPSVSYLPATNNRTGDAYIVTTGLADTPNIYVFNGSSYINVTQSSSVAGILTLHRQNFFANEFHLTNDQADAVVGSSGNPPSLTNPYVDSLDTRIPSQDENDALQGVSNSIYDLAVVPPSDTNRFISESRQFAIPTEKAYTAQLSNNLELSITDGPSWIGLETGMASAFKYFNLYNSNENIHEEYVNTLGNVPKLIGIYTANSFIPELDPSTYTTGFYTNTGSLWLVFDQPLDSSFRLSYLKQKLAGALPPDAFIRRQPTDAQVQSKLLYNKKQQVFEIASPTSVLTLNPLIFNMHSSSLIYDVVVKENGVTLLPEDMTFKNINIQLNTNDTLDFDDSVYGPKTIVLNTGIYSSIPLTVLLNDLMSKMNAVTAPNRYTWTFDLTTWSFLVVNNVSALFSLLFNSGSNILKSPYQSLGFSNIDYTSQYYYQGNMINRGHVEWYKLNSTQIQLTRNAVANGVFVVEKSFNL